MKTVGGLLLLDGVVLLLLSLSSCTAEDGHVYQNIVDCQYSKEDLSDMVYMIKLVFNQKLMCDYDSRRGWYVGYDEFGMKNAGRYNNQTWKMRQRKVEVETICKANARYYVNTTMRQVPPVAIVQLPLKAHYGQLTMLECNVYDFYPMDITVTWLKDDTVVPKGTFSSEIMANGDWTYQFHSYLEVVLEKGQKVSCQVDHSSLKEPLIVVLDSSSLDVRGYKLALGISFLMIGLSVAVGGVFYYYWTRHEGVSGFALVSLR